MTQKTHSSRKPIIIGITAAFLLASAGLGMALWQKQQPPTPAAQSPAGAIEEIPSSPLFNQALMRIDGIPPETRLSGTLVLEDGQRYEVEELDQRHGQRVLGITPSLPNDFAAADYTLELKLIDEENLNRTIVFTLSNVPDQSYGVASTTLRNFPEGTNAMLATGGFIQQQPENVDWGGHVSLQAPYQQRDLFQLYIKINPYERYTLYAGSYLPSYLQTFTQETPRNEFRNIEAFVMSDEATTPEANKLATDLASGQAPAMGWWITPDFLLTKIQDESCALSCPIKIYEKSLDGWNEIFSSSISNIWLDASKLTEPGNQLYTQSGYDDVMFWEFDDGAYRPLQGGAPSP